MYVVVCFEGVYYNNKIFGILFEILEIKLFKNVFNNTVVDDTHSSSII